MSGCWIISQVLGRCAEFFIDHGQYDKAVRLYVMGKKYNQAIELCLNQKVKITEELAEKLSPEVGGEGEKGKKGRVNKLHEIGDLVAGQRI